MIAAIVLAAGESRRMGYPKALLRYRGRTFLESVLQATEAAGIERRVVVVGFDADKILSSHDLSSCTVVRTENQEAGPIGSIRAGIRSVINHPVEAVLVWPVDQPHIAVSTLQALLERFVQTRSAIVLPTHAGRRGHPVLFSREVFDELLWAPDAEGARAVVHARPRRVVEVPVPDSAVVEDIDTQAAYENLIRRSAFPPENPPAKTRR